jgi:outer membrane immunogenic protein
MSLTLYRRGVVSKSILRIIALLVLGTAGAAAEEMASPPSQFVSRVLPYLPWTGFYAGINGSYAWGNSSATFAPNDPAAQSGTCGAGGTPKGQCIPSPDFRRDGPLAGGEFGYTWQFNSHWLVGGEADYQWAHFTGSVNAPFRLGNVGNTNMVVSQKVESFGTVRARMGVVLLPALVLYGTGGFAYGEVNESLSVPSVVTGIPAGLAAGGFSYSCIAGGTPCFRGSSSKFLPGWAGGAGADYAITSNLVFRTEVLYVHLNTNTTTVPATGVANPASFTAGFSPVYFATARFGLYWRF